MGAYRSRRADATGLALAAAVAALAFGGVLQTFRMIVDDPPPPSKTPAVTSTVPSTAPTTTRPARPDGCLQARDSCRRTE
ncbi:hypothetical protein [Actinoplanes solisilvae]|uniref:hypothetical protein n=1 Tax=Actinoplanes solisilvae TaxID=2486853 RepID=UPI000FD81529|nr:hypothetical protein [Actinoplanes solisilvae]